MLQFFLNFPFLNVNEKKKMRMWMGGGREVNFLRRVNVERKEKSGGGTTR